MYDNQEARDFNPTTWEVISEEKNKELGQGMAEEIEEPYQTVQQILNDHKRSNKNIRSLA